MDTLPLPELKMIAGIRRAAERACGRPGLVALGIGDDCAVLRPRRGHELLVTTDFCIENIHFRRAWHPAESAGHRCLARGLSDIAAMGGEPGAAFLSLALPARTPQRWVDGFLRGMLRLARRFQVELAGGDIAESKAGIAADIVVVGSVPADRAILRSGAMPGDIVCVSGALGGPARTLRQLRAGCNASAVASEHAAHFFPEPRVGAGRWLREHRVASAMIDLSDGLSTDLVHICDASGMGAQLAEAKLPRAPGATLRDALHGGEDYELLFTIPRKRLEKLPRRIAGVPVHVIGEITRQRGIWILNAKAERTRLQPRGWQHFSLP